MSADIRRRLLTHIPGSSDKNLPIGGSESPRYIQLRLEAYNAFLKLNTDTNNDMYFDATDRVRAITRELQQHKR